MNYTLSTWEQEGNKITAYGRGIIAECPNSNKGGVLEFIANAQLIAAAPDMYEALKDIVNLWEAQNPPDNVKSWQIIKANLALSKAEGK